MNKIISILKNQKPIPVDRFMSIALYNKKFGYYMKKNPFGKKGDFITSPHVSNFFGEMIGIWCVAFWEHLGKPKKISIIEMGPGDATLCKNLLDTFKNFNNFYDCVDIKLLEISNELKKIQKAKINNKRVKWIKSINALDSQPKIFLCNEFFDSLPIKQLFIKKNSIYEKYIKVSKSNKVEFIYKKAKNNLLKNIKNLNLITQNSIIEYPINSIKYLTKISKSINNCGGGLLSFDYGYTDGKSKNTLQSLKKHKYLNVLSKPGKADITSHINYKLFKEVLKKNHMDVEKIISQSEFLKKLGILERANMLSKKISFKEKIDMFFRLKRLLSHKEMGSLFKVLFAQKKKTKFSLGF